MRCRKFQVASYEGAGKETQIATTSVSPGSEVVSFTVGAVPGAGTFFCAACGSHLSLRENEQLPECSCCGAGEFRRDSIFEPMQEHGQTAEHQLLTTDSPPKWLPVARDRLDEPGRYLACRDEDGEIRTFKVRRGWTRIGRSANADIRLDDPSVSRRHALVVSEQPDSLRVLDDRSLNGVFLNGEVVDWGRLEDGDELTIGRYHLFALEV